MSPTDRIPTSLRRYLLAFAVRRRLFLALRAVGSGVCLALVWTLVICVLDRYAEFGQAARYASLTVAVLTVVGGVGVGMWQSIRALDWNAAASGIEARTSVFGERLQTVTSLVIANDPARSSPAMLEQAVRQVDRLLSRAPIAQLLPWRLALVPWAAAGVTALIITLAAMVPGWQFDRLLARAIFPQKPVDAVTTTHLQVWPRSTRVSQGETLTVSADVTGERAAAAAQSRGVDLYLSADGKTWSRAAMNPTELGAKESHFEFAIPAIDRNLQYYIKGGDARSDVYFIQVHRVPVVAGFRIHYDYPEYANHAPVTVTNTDGSVECLSGSMATVTMTATEPLASATWMLGRDRLSMTRQEKAEEWQVSFPVTQSVNCSLEMMSAAGVAGRGPLPMPARAVADEGPKAVVLQPAADVRLEAADSLLVRIAGSDDYGLHALDCQILVNGRPVARVSIPVPTKPLRREGEFSLDLPLLELSLGDVVSMKVEAEDQLHQWTFGEARSVLVAPVSVSPRAYERATELRRATGLARAWHEDLNKARKALDAARASDPKSTKQDPWLAAGRAMSLAADGASALRQSLLRSEARADNAGLADALAKWIDQTEAVLVEPGRPLSPASRADEALSNRLNALIAGTRDLAGQIDAVQQGERALVALRELKNHKALAALPRSPATEPGAAEAVAQRVKAVDGLKASLDKWLREMSLNAGMPNLDQQLQQRIDHERDTINGMHAPDLMAAAQEWAGRTAKTSAITAAEFPARLKTAAIVQGLRPDGNLALARDLELAGRVATVMAQSLHESDRPRPANEKGGAKPKPPSSAPMLPQFQVALGQLLSGKDADAGRLRLQGWLSGAAGTDAGDAAEVWAFEASAREGSGAYEMAAQADAKLAEEVARWSPDQSARFAQSAARSLAQLKDIDVLLEEQTAVRQLTENADPDGDAAERQGQLAEAIKELRRPGEALPTLALASAAEANMESENPGAMNLLPEPSPELAARRPALAAAWHARAAADALEGLLDEADAAAVADLWQRAVEQQWQVATYLKLAARQANHREALRRLAEVPSLAAIFQPTTAEGVLASPLLGGRAQDWLKLGTTEKPPAPDSPAGKVQDQIQAYFESISKAQQERK